MPFSPNRRRTPPRGNQHRQPGHHRPSSRERMHSTGRTPPQRHYHDTCENPPPPPPEPFPTGNYVIEPSALSNGSSPYPSSASSARSHYGHPHSFDNDYHQNPFGRQFHDSGGYHGYDHSSAGGNNFYRSDYASPPYHNPDHGHNHWNHSNNHVNGPPPYNGGRNEVWINNCSDALSRSNSSVTDSACTEIGYGSNKRDRDEEEGLETDTKRQRSHDSKEGSEDDETFSILDELNMAVREAASGFYYQGLKIAEKDAKISKLEKESIERKAELADKDAKILELEKDSIDTKVELVEKSSAILQLEKESIDREAVLEKKDAELVEKDALIEQLQKDLASANALAETWKSHQGKRADYNKKHYEKNKNHRLRDSTSVVVLPSGDQTVSDAGRLIDGYVKMAGRLTDRLIDGYDKMSGRVVELARAQQNLNGEGPTENHEENVDGEDHHSEYRRKKVSP